MNTPPLMKTIALASCALPGLALANVPLLENPDFASNEGWVAGANSYIGGTWQQFLQIDVVDVVSASGNGHEFISIDDEESDRLENFLLQEFNAGPAGGAWATELFETGDVIRFKGSASATTSDTDVTVRAFIKMLGFVNNQAFFPKPEKTVYFDLTENLQSFDLSIEFPDLAADDSYQLLQVGFEISTEWDGSQMDSGTIYFENLEAFIEGEATTEWNGFVVNESGIADTGDFMGPVFVSESPWVYVYDLAKWAYLPESQDMAAGAWINVVN